MNKIEYFKRGIKNKLYEELVWLKTILGEPLSNNEYYKDGKYLMDGEWYEIGQLELTDVVTITKDELSCVETEVRTSVGRAIFNAIILDGPFKGKIPFINKSIDMGDVVKEILVYNNRLDEETWVTGVKLVSAHATFLTQIVAYTVQSQSDKTLVPPTGIDEYTDKLKKEMFKKYGPDAFESLSVISEFESALVAYDKAYLKSEVDNNVIMASGKPAKISRKKAMLNYGSATSMVKRSTTNSIMSPLRKGISIEPSIFKLAVNDIRKASSDRGKDTQMGGVIASILTRALHQFVILDEDCGSTEYERYLVSDPMSFRDYYYIKDGTPVLVTADNAHTIGGKEIDFRTTRYCKSNALNFTYCKVCAGESLSRLKGSIPLAGATMGGSYLNILMKSMHDSTVYTVAVDKTDMFT
jgi:hypothetical protein